MFSPYDKSCYLLTLYRACVVMLESSENKENNELSRLLCVIIVGLELALRPWAETQDKMLDTDVLVMVDRVGREQLIEDATKLIDLLKKDFSTIVSTTTISKVRDD